MYVFDCLRFNFKTQDLRNYGNEKREVRSHNKVHALFAENKVCFAHAEQL